tara:strand:- start:12760 stop:12912 length:153 start_codon:yes stop_codon:yes gene_type:complete
MVNIYRYDTLEKDEVIEDLVDALIIFMYVKTTQRPTFPNYYEPSTNRVLL